jgi:hypothetical protein
MTLPSVIGFQDLSGVPQIMPNIFGLRFRYTRQVLVV